MAPKVAPVAIISPAAGTFASDDSVSPPAPRSVQGRQQRFMQAIEEASTEAQVQKDKDAFPYGITVPFKVRDAVPGNKVASAKVFLKEAPIQALKDMCFYLELDEAGTAEDLIANLVEYFTMLFPDRCKAVSTKATRGAVQEKVAAGPTPARARSLGSKAPLTADSSITDIKARLTELGKPIYGAKDALLKRLQDAEGEQKEAPSRAATDKLVAQLQAGKKRKSAPEEPKAALKKQKTAELEKKKTTGNLQDQYCVPGMSIEEQMKIAMKMSMEG